MGSLPYSRTARFFVESIGRSVRRGELSGLFLRKVLDEVVVGSALLIAARCAYSSALKQKFFRGDRL